ncbi:Cell cycle checkpoint protein RAD17 [Amphibalanus amphitrite]|uniref:Cell cycle checkpoint protein RAD17 n=1 Tax=Amphibalanus amphitrite TaxID=1232801 RepID=A0A6A4WTA9_AMPAM|nr:Cell cycle checkpoint protein RAD17 [Amphibalanus amphitrite]
MWVRSSFGGVEPSSVAPVPSRRRARPARSAPRPAPVPAAGPAAGAGTLWAERHRPTSTQQLAVHRTKVEELERWLLDTGRRLAAGSAASPFLLVTGPAGCGKSACVRCVADKLGLFLVQWTTPASGRHQRDRMLEDPWEGQGDTVTPEGQLRQFADFLVRANRYGSVLPSGGGGARLVLVDDLPNAISYRKEEFYDVLRRYGRGARSPCVFVMSDGGARSDLDVLSVFPDSVRAELGIHQITFRPLTNKQLVTAMERVLTAETGVSHPGRATLDELAAAASGDIRSAINALQFLCVQATPGRTDKSAKNKSKSAPPPSKKARLKSDSAAEEAVAAVGSRDATLGLFRTVGKIMYAKRGEGWESPELPAHQSSHRRPPLLERHPELVCARAGVQPETLVAHLHHNYPEFCPRLEDAVAAAGYISDADMITADWQSRVAMQAYSSSVAARGVMFCRQTTVSLGFRQFSQPRLTSVEQQRGKRLESLRDCLAEWRVPADTLVTELLPFLRLRGAAAPFRPSATTLPSYDMPFYKRIYQPALDRPGSCDSDEDGEESIEIEEYAD